MERQAGESRQSGLTLLEQRREEKPPWDQETALGTGARVGTPELLLGNFCTQCGQFRERTLGGPRQRAAATMLRVTVRSTARFPQYISEKSRLVLWQGEGSISVLNKARPQEKLVNQTLTCWGITRAYLTPGRKTPTPAHSSHPLPCKEERKKQTNNNNKNLRNTCEVQEPRPGFTKKTNKKL